MLFILLWLWFTLPLHRIEKEREDEKASLHCFHVMRIDDDVHRLQE